MVRKNEAFPLVTNVATNLTDHPQPGGLGWRN
jgi:hypothetical protein